jgi:hypothetical protein
VSNSNGAGVRHSLRRTPVSFVIPLTGVASKESRHSPRFVVVQRQALVLVLVLVLDFFSAVRKNPASFSRWALPRTTERPWSGISSTIDNDNDNDNEDEDEDDWRGVMGAREA